MNGRLVAALALMVASAGFAGCIEGMSFLSASEDEVSAMENRGLADSAAQAWAPDAQLMAVFAFETTDLNMTQGVFPTDPTPGNGLAPMWLYGYAGNNGTEHRAFQVTADGMVSVMNETMGEVPALGEPVNNWNIDSDKAVELALANESFAAVAGTEGASLMNGLGAEDDTLVWAIMAGTMSGQAIAVINAADGSLIMAEAFTLEMPDIDVPTWGMPGASGMGPQVDMSESGTATPGSPMEYEFDVGYADHGMLSLSYSKSLPVEGLRVSILPVTEDEDAEPVATQTFGTGDPSPNGGGAFDFEIEPGSYKLVVSYTSMTRFLPVPIGSVDYDFNLVVGEMPEDMEM